MFCDDFFFKSCLILYFCMLSFRSSLFSWSKSINKWWNVAIASLILSYFHYLFFISVVMINVLASVSLKVTTQQLPTYQCLPYKSPNCQLSNHSRINGRSCLQNKWILQSWLYLISQSLDFFQRGSLSPHQGLLLRTHIRRLQQYNTQGGEKKKNTTCATCRREKK